MKPLLVGGRVSRGVIWLVPDPPLPRFVLNPRINTQDLPEQTHLAGSYLYRLPKTARSCALWEGLAPGAAR